MICLRNKKEYRMNEPLTLSDWFPGKKVKLLQEFYELPDDEHAVFIVWSIPNDNHCVIKQSNVALFPKSRTFVVTLDMIIGI